MKIRLATRESPLALAQAKLVSHQLQALEPRMQVELKPVTTTGDQLLQQTLAKIGGKGLFIKELEAMLLTGEADIAVHSMKDLPANLDARFHIAAILKRESVSDCLVSQRATTLAALPVGSIVGTSSLRRQCQLLASYPQLQAKWVRGNVGTRLKKLANNEYDALILATAGLKRLHLQTEITEEISTETILPAIGQGALAIECLAESIELQQMLQVLNDGETACCVMAEREMGRHLQATCSVPVAGFAQINNKTLQLQGLVGTPDGQTILRASATADKNQWKHLGHTVADQLINQGAMAIIQAAIK